MVCPPPQGSVSCMMCKGAVSVRAGNLERFKVHVESDHDVFYDQDLLIAINFLEPHEKEVIIEKVLPRMKNIFQEVKAFKRAGNENKLQIEKRIYEPVEDSSMQENVKKARYDEDIIEPNINQSYEEIAIEDSEVEYERRAEINRYNLARGDETLTEISEPAVNRNSGRQNGAESEFSNCDVCHQQVRKSLLDFHKKSHYPVPDHPRYPPPDHPDQHRYPAPDHPDQPPRPVPDPNLAECPHCKKMMQRRSLWKHKPRCSLKTDRSFSEDSPLAEIPEVSSAESFECKICFSKYPKLSILKRHTTVEHSVELEDVEQMLGGNPVQKQEPVPDMDKTEDRLENISNTTETVTEPGNNGALKFKCKFCDDVFTKRNNARRHERRRHPEVAFNA